MNKLKVPPMFRIESFVSSRLNSSRAVAVNGSGIINSRKSGRAI